MVALERVKEYLELPQEPPAVVEPRPPAEWPSSGQIECRDLVLRYAPDLPDVLHNLSFTIAPGEKVGILGRTGSGKSTLAVAFFRFVEAHSGSIRIDGQDIAGIGLADLRSRITIIPRTRQHSLNTFHYTMLTHVNRGSNDPERHDSKQP